MPKPTIPPPSWVDVQDRIDPRVLRKGDPILLDYNHRGGTVPHPRRVTITEVNQEGFRYRIDAIGVLSGSLQGIDPGVPPITWLSPEEARRIGIRCKRDRLVRFQDFLTNMHRASRRLP